MTGAFQAATYESSCRSTMIAQTASTPILFFNQTDDELQVGGASGQPSTLTFENCHGDRSTQEWTPPFATPSGQRCSPRLGSPVLGSDGLWHVDDESTASCLDGTLREIQKIHLVGRSPCPTSADFNFSATPLEAVSSNGVVAFNATAPGGAVVTWDFGDRTAGAGLSPSHAYGAGSRGEVEVTMTVTTGGCRPASRTETIVSDPVATYAPTVHLAKGDKYQADSVNAFLDNALLVRDQPQLKKTDPRGDAFPGCVDDIVAAGSAIRSRVARSSSSQHKKAKKRAKIPKELDELSAGRLSGRSGRYDVAAVGWHDDPVETPEVIAHHYSCERGEGRTRSSSSSGSKNEATDDGFVLSQAAAPRKVARGRTSRAPFYAVFSPGTRMIEYWFFYPRNEWEAATGRVTERHEGDWEHVVVRLQGRNYTMDKVAYYQHYCRGESVDRKKLDLTARTHPPVWAAKGGHASYPRDEGIVYKGSCPDEHPLKDSLHYQGTGDHTISGGTKWEPWKHAGKKNGVVDATAQAWFGTHAAWGDAKQASVSNYGPKAPGTNAYALPPSWTS